MVPVGAHSTESRVETAMTYTLPRTAYKISPTEPKFICSSIDGCTLAGKVYRDKSVVAQIPIPLIEFCACCVYF